MEFKALFVLLIVLCFFTPPITAIEINPSVESQPLFCKYSITSWTSLCPRASGSGTQGPQGIPGTGNITVFNNMSGNLTTISNYTVYNLINVTYSEMNQTPNMTAGPQGAQGIQGIQGLQGVNGTPGIQGVNGTPGATGPAGAKGDKGDTGLTGATGPAGADGADGAANMTAGPTGPQGVNGTPGIDGATGPQGIQGINGTEGLPGAKGDKGDKGDQGEPGAANMTAGPQGIQGVNGTPGDPGPQGIQGIQGIQGPAGTNGLNNMTMNLTANMTAGPQGPEGPANTTMLNASYQTIANQSAYDIAVNTSMKAYVDGFTSVARVTNTLDTSLATGTTTVLKFDTEKYDTDNIHSTSTNTDRLTAARSGYYYIVSEARFVQTGAVGLIIWYNGITSISSAFIYSSTDAYPTQLNTDTVYYLNSGDFVNVTAYSAASGKKVTAGAEYSPVFAISRIG